MGAALHAAEPRAGGTRAVDSGRRRRDATSGGDSFVAALTVGLARGWPLKTAARYGVAAAAAAVTTEATELCKRETVDRFFAEIGGNLELAN